MQGLMQAGITLNNGNPGTALMKLFSVLPIFQKRIFINRTFFKINYPTIGQSHI